MTVSLSRLAPSLRVLCMNLIDLAPAWGVPLSRLRDASVVDTGFDLAHFFKKESVPGLSRRHDFVARDTAFGLSQVCRSRLRTTGSHHTQGRTLIRWSHQAGIGSNHPATWLRKILTFPALPGTRYRWPMNCWEISSTQPSPLKIISPSDVGSLWDGGSSLRPLENAA
jgi:hypothetical protein